MHQLQFLGRTPVAQGRRAAIGNLLHHFSHLGSLFGHDDFLDRYLSGEGFDREEIEAIKKDPEATLRRIRSVDRTAPELLGELRRMGASPSLVGDVERFGDAIADVPHLLHIDRCERDDGGSFAVSYYLPEHSGDVEEGDRFFAGVCLSGNVSKGTLNVAPRVLRQVCVNGMVAVTNETESCGVFNRDQQGVSGDVGDAVGTGLSCETVDAVVERMQWLKLRKVKDPIEALEEEGVQVPAGAQNEVRRVHAENGDDTAYGAFNALTQTARDQRSVADRMLLEQRAGAVLPSSILRLHGARSAEGEARWR